MKESVRLGRIAGVSVGFNWSLLLIAAFLAIGLGNARFPVEAPGYPGLSYAAAGAVTALAFLACILIHEISHAIVAKHEGLPVDGIVLWLMGGYTRIGGDPKGPGAELRVVRGRAADQPGARPARRCRRGSRPSPRCFPPRGVHARVAGDDQCRAGRVQRLARLPT